MSILLETLNHQENDKQQLSSALPNVHSSHYDDEMLGDEWLYRRLNKWRLVSLLLLLALLASWCYFIFNNQSAQLSSEQLQLTKINSTQDKNIETQAIQTQATQTEHFIVQKSIVSQVEKSQVVTNSEKSSDVIIETNKQLYVPQKRIVSEQTKPETIESETIELEKKSQEKIVSPVKKNFGSNQSIKVTKNNFELAIDKNALPSELLENFPEIEINSYVVADKAEESFVILDGSFYKINQMIASDLILRQITADYMVVEFQDQLVKIKFK